MSVQAVDNDTYFSTLTRDLRDAGILRPESELSEEAWGYAFAVDRRILDWLGRRLGMWQLVPAFRLGVARAEISLRDGLWQPVDTTARDAYGVQVITLPVLCDPEDYSSVVDILAFDAEDPMRCWLRRGNVDVLGEAALEWARAAGEALNVYASPWTWLRGYAAVLEQHWSERRSVEAEVREMAAKTAIEMKRTGWQWLRWAETTLRVWMEQRMPKLLRAQLHGVCVLDHRQSYERLFADVPTLVGEGPAHARWLAEKLKDDRRRRRQAERLPEVGFVASEAMGVAAA